MKQKLNVLVKMAKRLNEAHVTWAVGASLLLYFKGIVEEFHDIDLMIAEEDVECVKHLLLEMGDMQEREANPQYKTKYFLEFQIEEVDVDVMAGFVIVSNGEDYPIFFDQSCIAEYKELEGVPIPLQALESWKAYYALMGRENKVKMIEDWLKNNAR